MENWHLLDRASVQDKLNVDPSKGLSPEIVKQRQAEFGPNELQEKSGRTVWSIIWEQVTGIMVVILVVSAVISLILGEYTDAIVILVIVVLNAILGFTQEYRAEQAMAALKQMAVPHVRVRRNNHVAEISAKELVPGDVILVEAGNAVPADCRIIEAANLRAQEAVLTGESEPVEKITDAIEGEHAALGDRKNLLYMGTAITYGRGQAIVVETGMNTELGKIASLIQGVGQESTPLQRRLEQLGKGLAVAALGIVALVFLFGLLRGEDPRLMFQTAISMAVAAVPEGLAAVVTIALALGAQRMLSRRALIRKLPAVETLGSVTVICSDKTGTLTENRMTVTVVDVAGNRMDFQEHVREYAPSLNTSDPATSALLDHPAVNLLLTGGTLCNDAILEKSDDKAPGEITAVGDPTEGALVIAAARTGLWKEELETIMPRLAELPFDSDRKRMSTAHAFDPNTVPAELKELSALAGNARFVSVTKGAIDGLLTVTSKVLVENQIVPLDPDLTTRILNANESMAGKGMRVLGVAIRFWNQPEFEQDNELLENDLIFVGMFGMIDPARPEVKLAVSTARTAGIRPIMITGDHPLTALHIATELGIATNREVITGQELAVMSVEELEKRVDHVSVFARVSPEHKLKIVQALQDKGEIVAMTGDGVNDAPALKKADIGVAMGITGTDVSKEAADMVLLDDNFSTIVAAVEEGRRIYDNIRKFIRYTMTSNAGEIWVMLLAPFFGMPMPLTPLQILWVNLVTDGLPGLALTVEPLERNAMRRKPISTTENIFGRGLGRDVLWIGLLMGILSLLAGWFNFTAGDESWHTMVFTTITMVQMANALTVRSEKESIFQIGLLSNKSMLGAVLLTFALQLGVIYLPFMQAIFNTVPLSFGDLMVSLGISFGALLIIEGGKYLFNRNK